MSKMHATYWRTARRIDRFGDALSVPTYQPEGVYAEDRFNYTTRRGYDMHVATIRNGITRNGGRIVAQQTYPGGALLIIYRDRLAESMPHAAPAAITISAYRA